MSGFCVFGGKFVLIFMFFKSSFNVCCYASVERIVGTSYHIDIINFIHIKIIAVMSFCVKGIRIFFWGSISFGII